MDRKSPFEPTASLFGAPLVVTPLTFCRYFWQQKTGVPGLSWCGVICVILRLAVLVQHRRMTDRRTDKRTDRHTTTVYTALA